MHTEKEEKYRDQKNLEKLLFAQQSNENTWLYLKKNQQVGVPTVVVFKGTT